MRRCRSAPPPRLFLCLPVVQNFDAVGVRRVVGNANGVVDTSTAIATADPGSAAGAAVISEPQSFSDLDEVRRTADFQAQVSGARFKRGVAGRARHFGSPTFSNFSPKRGGKFRWTIAHTDVLSN